MDKNVEKVLYAVIFLVIINIIGILFFLEKSLDKKEIKLFSVGEALDFNDVQLKDRKDIKSPIRISNVIKGSDSPNSLDISFVSGEMVEIPINEPEEFDYKSREEVFATRFATIESYKELVGKNFINNYNFYNPVFGAIESGKPWWGLKGNVCKGSGKFSNAGRSEESRFINNPMLLLGINTGWAWIMLWWNCPELYPEPHSLKIIPAKKTFWATFVVSNFHKEVFSRVNVGNSPEKKEEIKYFYELDALNARDFGYEYGFVAKSKNIKFKYPENISTAPYHFKNFIHVGGSCGLDGGCNNGSPYQGELLFKIENYPAEMTVHLFKEKPASNNAEPDIIYQITLL